MLSNRPALSVVKAEPGQSRYAAVAAALRARVVAGEWTPGTAMPSEQALAQQHGVALTTLRRALELLQHEGMVERVHGRGTFVRASLDGASMVRFFRFGDGTGEVPQSRIVSRRRMTASADVAMRLGVAPGEPVLHLLRVRVLGGAPCLLEEIWLPLPLFEPLAESDPAGWNDLFYPLFAERCGVYIHRAADEIGFATFSAAQAKHLSLPPGHPCARVTRRAYDLAGRCVEARITHGDAFAFHYAVTIT